MLRYIFLLCSIPCCLALGSCDSQSESQESSVSPAPAKEAYVYNSVPVVAAMEKAHKVELYHEQEAVAFDIELHFRGKLRLAATVSMLTGSGKIRMDKSDGTSVVYDGDQVYVSPPDQASPSLRFDIFTWQYFFEAPFKFSDPGTHWEDTGKQDLNGQEYASAKLTFEPGTGDSHKDWYWVYSRDANPLVHAMAYIVTYSKSAEEAEEEPHAIAYADYEEVEGIPIARRWNFYMWTEEKGLFDQLGYAKIQNVRFFEPEAGHFVLSGEKAPIDYPQ